MENEENVKENEVVVENTQGETNTIKISDDVVAVIAGKGCS